MFKFLLFILIFYIIYRAFKYFLKIFILAKTGGESVRRDGKANSNSKYKNVEEAKYIEIETTKNISEPDEKK